MNVLAQQQYRVNGFGIWLTLVGPDDDYHGYGNGTSVLVSNGMDSEPTDILDTRYETDLWEPKNLKQWGKGYLEHRFGGTVTCI